jgi:hypothetical protein
MVWFVVAVLVARVQHYATLPRRGQYNGIETMEATLNRTAKAPMVYRVLMPYLVKITPLDDENAYELWRTLLLWGALLSVYSVWGVSATLFYAVFVASAQIYDTWCYNGETIGIHTALLGVPALAIVGILLHGTSRETVLINGFVYWLATGDILGGLALSAFAMLIFYAVRKAQGKREMYCDRFVYKDNWKLLRKKIDPIRLFPEPHIIYSPYITLIAIALVLFGAYHVGIVGLFVLPFILANVTMGKINEYRLYIALSPFVWVALERML